MDYLQLNIYLIQIGNIGGNTGLVKWHYFLAVTASQLILHEVAVLNKTEIRIEQHTHI